MAGRHRDPLRPLVAAVIGLVVVIGVVLLLCWYADVPSADFWENS